MSTKHGVEAKSYEGLGDANKLKPLEVELKRLEDLSESIVQVISLLDCHISSCDATNAGRHLLAILIELYHFLGTELVIFRLVL